MREHTTCARGFSPFVFVDNRFFAVSRDLAVRIGSELRATSKRPSGHHSEPIEGLWCLPPAPHHQRIWSEMTGA
jgi:hypothetical protein